MVEKVEIHLLPLQVKLQLPQMEEVVVENLKLVQMQELMVQEVVQDTTQIIQQMVQMEQQDKDLMVEMLLLQMLLNKVVQVVEHLQMEQMVVQHQKLMEEQDYLLL